MTLPAMMFSSLGEGRRVVGANDDASARQALADVVVGVAAQSQGHAGGA